MGLERISAVMQGVHSNYDIDLFKNLIRAAGELAGTSVLTSSSLRVIADHIRASTFLVVDGVLPSNEGRGYVLRRIIRRALRHGYKLGIQEPFFYKLVEVLEAEMGDAYPELTRGRATRSACCNRRGALRGDARQGHGVARGRHSQPAGRKGDRRRHRVQAVRHLWLSGRFDGRRGARARPRDRPDAL